MSKVYSFRLSEDNPREIKATEVMKAWISQGYPLRYILTEALIGLGNKGDSIEGMEKFFDRLIPVIERLVNGEVDIRNGSGDLNSALQESFIASVIKSAKQDLNTG
jgi:hypothetical protein